MTSKLLETVSSPSVCPDEKKLQHICCSTEATLVFTACLGSCNLWLSFKAPKNWRKNFSYRIKLSQNRSKCRLESTHPFRISVAELL